MSLFFLLKTIYFIHLISNFITSQTIKIKTEGENYKTYNISIASFGSIPYGQSLVSIAYYDFSNTDIEYACKEQEIKYKKENSLLNLLIVNRGNCTFVTKARNAQNNQFDGVIVINNNNDDVKNLYMMDDGNGEVIYIPSVIISKKDGEEILNYLKNNPSLRLQLDFPIRKTSEVILDIVMSSTSIDMYELLIELRSFISSLDKNKFAFYPVYYSQESPYFNDKEMDEKEVNELIKYDCYFKGKYCYYLNYDEILLGIENGTQVLQENIRQICIFRARDEERNFDLFFNYIESFYIQCMKDSSNSTKKEEYFSEECSLKVLKSIANQEKINEIKQCVETSFESNGDNFYLRKEKEFQSKMNVNMYPSIIVNKELIFGDHSIYNVLEAICYSYIESNSLCQELGFASPTTDKKMNGNDSKIVDTGLSVVSIVLIIIGIIIFNIVIIFGCRYYLKRKMLTKMNSFNLDDKITSTVSNYIALKN